MFWCSNLNVGDHVTICAYGKQYQGFISEKKPQSHPRITCKDRPDLSGAYSFRRGFKYGSTDIHILI